MVPIHLFIYHLVVMTKYNVNICLLVAIVLCACKGTREEKNSRTPSFTLRETERFLFNSFVDCNMAEVWIGDTLRIFPGKYGEDPEWGNALELEYADGINPDEVFLKKPDEFIDPVLPPNAPIGQPGLHGAVWFETVYQDKKDNSGRTLYACITMKIIRLPCLMILQRAKVTSTRTGRRDYEVRHP